MELYSAISFEEPAKFEARNYLRFYAFYSINASLPIANFSKLENVQYRGPIFFKFSVCFRGAPFNTSICPLPGFIRIKKKQLAFHIFSSDETERPKFKNRPCTYFF